MIAYLRFLSGRQRSREGNRHLGMTLTFVAGAVNAGGFLAIGRYTSHMTGVLSSIADNLVLNESRLVLAGAATALSFAAGAATSALLINWARRKNLHSQYASALMLEATLLLAFGLLGANPLAAGTHFAAATALLLSFLMGLQNAMITKISTAEIRTTHMTGNLTDLGIELGKLFYWNRDPTMQEKVLANRDKLRIHAGLIAAFMAGGFAGAHAFKRFSFAATLPLAVLLFIVAAVPVWDDLSETVI